MHLHNRAGTLASLLYKAEKRSVRPSVQLHFCHTDILVVSSLIETGLAQNESCVLEKDQVYFNKPTEPNVHRQECIKDDCVSSHYSVIIWPVVQTLLNKFFILVN